MKENLKKYLGYIVAVIALLLMTYTCVNNSAIKADGASNVYEKQLERRVKSLKSREVEYKKYTDSLSLDDKKKDSTITALKQKNSIISAKLAENEKKRQVDIRKVKSFTYKQSSDYIAKTYNAPQSVSYTNTGIVLTDSVPNRVVETIVEKASLENKVILTESKLTNVTSENKELEGKVENKDAALKEALKLGEEKDEALQLSKEFNESVSKENRKLKTIKFVDKLLIISAFIGGVLIGN